MAFDQTKWFNKNECHNLYNFVDANVGSTGTAQGSKADILLLSRENDPDVSGTVQGTSSIASTPSRESLGVSLDQSIIFNENYSNYTLKTTILKSPISFDLLPSAPRVVRGMIRRVFMPLLRIYRSFPLKMDIWREICEKHEKEPLKYSFYL